MGDKKDEVQPENESQGAPFESTGNWALDALLQPGSSVSKGMLGFLDKVFVALILCIFFLIWLTGGKEFHTYVFLFLALGLVASVKFFVSELRKAQADGSFRVGDEQDVGSEHNRLQEQLQMSQFLQKQIEAKRAEEQQQEIRRRATAAATGAATEAGGIRQVQD